MVVKYWPVAAQREEKALPFLVKQVHRADIADYLQTGRRCTMRGITLYTKPTDSLEVGFLIRSKAGNAVNRNKTRRVFRGLLMNALVLFPVQQGYLFLFHRSFLSSPLMAKTLMQLITRPVHAA